MLLDITYILNADQHKESAHFHWHSWFRSVHQPALSSYRQVPPCNITLVGWCKDLRSIKHASFRCSPTL